MRIRKKGKNQKEKKKSIVKKKTRKYDVPKSVRIARKSKNKYNKSLASSVGRALDS